MYIASCVGMLEQESIGVIMSFPKLSETITDILFPVIFKHAESRNVLGNQRVCELLSAGDAIEHKTSQITQ